MSNVSVRFLEPEAFYLVDAFCQRQGIPLLDPKFSKVVAAIDLDSGEVVGIVAAQMVLHAEAIWVDEASRGGRIWLDMAEMMDSYLMVMGAAGVYNQPTNPTAEKLAEKMGYVKSDKPLYVKSYTKAEE